MGRDTPGSGPVAVPMVLRHPDALRLLAFVLAVMTLFSVARQGQGQAVIYLALAGFLVTATLWVRGLDANSVEGREDFRSRPLLVLALALPTLLTVLIWIRVERAPSTFVLGALITVYVGAGLLVRWLRWRVIRGGSAPAGSAAERGADRVLAIAFRWPVLVGLVVVAYLALWGLGRLPLALAGPVLLLAVLPLPAFVHVLSERQIVAMTVGDPDHDPVRRDRWIIGGAAAVGIGVAIGLAHLGDNTLVLALVIVVALLTWALTVGSLADIAAVLGVLALMGITPASQDVEPAVLSASAQAPRPGAPEQVVVSLGDSYSSGEGAMRYLDETNVAGGNQCRRAATAWPVLVTQGLGARRLVFRACSGARARNVVGEVAVDEQYDGEGIQVDAALRELRAADPTLQPALVLVSIGGNDAGFRQVGSSCLSLGRCDDPELSADFYDNLAAVESALRSTYLAIEDAFPGAPIAVMPYPDAFATDDGCARAPVEPGDIAFVRDFTDRLDAVIAEVAAEVGAYYVAPMRTAFTDAHLALCDPSGTPGLNFLDLRGVGGAALDRFNPGNWIHNSLHPNERGHAALAAAFGGWLSSQTRQDGDGTDLTGLAALMRPSLKRELDALPDPRDPADPATAPTRTDTDLCFEKAGGDCGPRADAWALSQLAPGATYPLLLGALVGGGSWFLSIGVSARRFRRGAGLSPPRCGSFSAEVRVVTS